MSHIRPHGNAPDWSAYKAWLQAHAEQVRSHEQSLRHLRELLAALDNPAQQTQRIATVHVILPTDVHKATVISW